MAAADKPVWTDYAHLAATKRGKATGKVWKVQINGDGVFRCSCPDFIFGWKRRGDVERNCKHCKWAIADRAGKIATPLPAGTADQHPLLATAHQIVLQLITAGELDKVFKSGGAGADRRIHAMTVALVPYLSIAHAAPAAPVPLTTSAPIQASGVRLITFEDD